ncbi:hypothetical protein [Ensifer sp. WSM1721]|uniref:hypothetical protein n=1 Tax=Ensifer sp. WSM1721 TaxID=1041159 RepID=UPI003523C210
MLIIGMPLDMPPAILLLGPIFFSRSNVFPGGPFDGSYLQPASPAARPISSLNREAKRTWMYPPCRCVLSKQWIVLIGR